jgi:hypothetical protein
MRVRWKRWLGKLVRTVWVLAAAVLLVFLLDLLVGLRVLSLRIAFTAILSGAAVLFAIDWITSWLTRVDELGLAQLLERRYPALSERLVTLVQLESAPIPNPEFASLLRDEAAIKLAKVEPESACTLRPERNRWLWTLSILGVAFIGLCFAPPFRFFAARLSLSWARPLTAYQIEVAEGSGIAIQGKPHTIRASVRQLDPFAPAPDKSSPCLVLVDQPDQSISMAIEQIAIAHDRDACACPIQTWLGALPTFKVAAQLENAQKSATCRIAIGETTSEPFTIAVVEPPHLKKIMLGVSAPYPSGSETEVRGIGKISGMSALQYSKLRLSFTFDRPCLGTLLLQKSKVAMRVLDGDGACQVLAEMLAGEPGDYTAEYRVEKISIGDSRTWTLAPENQFSIPIGEWTVRADTPPRFTQPLRFHGSSASLHAGSTYRIAPNDVVRLDTEIVDDEGLSAVELEFRINDEAPRTVPWIDGRGETKLTVHHWLPLPKGLKQGDRVQFRVRASDNRKLKQGEISENIPPVDLNPQVAIAPDAGDDGWIELQVDTSVGGLVKQEAEAQREEVVGVIEAIKKKVKDEADQVERLKRSIHLQAVLTLAQRQQTENLLKLNREISGDLVQASRRFGVNPSLSRLAEHFLDIAENEIAESGDALTRFGDKDRSLTQVEKELQTAHDALLAALKKLDRMLDFNKLIAQDRLDQQQLDALAKRQQDLADKLAELRANEPLDEAELAKQIEQIRQEQARLAEEANNMRDTNRLVQDSLADLQRDRAMKLAQAAEKLLAEQRAMRELGPEQLSPEAKKQLDDLARRQAELAERLEKSKHADPQAARAAADALKKPNIDGAIDRQKEEEQQLQDMLGKLLPGVAVNELREQVLALARKQKAIRDDLEKLGADLPRLNEAMLKERLKSLVSRERDLAGDIDILPIDPKDAKLRPAQQSATDLARQSADQLAAKDALRSFDSMEKVEQELKNLASLLPEKLVKDRNDIKDPAVRGKIEDVERFAKEQAKLREETQKLRADLLKAAAKKAGPPQREKTKQLAKELLEMAQKGNGPSRSIAKEAAESLEGAKKSMDAAKDAAAKGDVESAKMSEKEAEKQLAMAFKQLQMLAQDENAPQMKKDGDGGKTAEALNEGAKEMKIAEQALPKMPKNAQLAMQAAAQKLAQAADHAAKQTSRSIPRAATNPEAKARPMPGTGNAPNLPDEKLNAETVKSWGQLPGELKTRLIQDFRARYGDEYAELIQQYFERVSQTPMRKE